MAYRLPELAASFSSYGQKNWARSGMSASTLALAFPICIILPGFFAESLSNCLAEFHHKFGLRILLAFVIFAILLFNSSQQFRAVIHRKCHSTNSPICQLAYEIVGQRAAFWVAWSQMLDFLSTLALSALSLSEHSSFLFHPKMNSSTKIAFFQQNLPWPFPQQLDFIAIILPILAAFILLFNFGSYLAKEATNSGRGHFGLSDGILPSLIGNCLAELWPKDWLRVFLTIISLFLVATLFTMTSTGTVALLHSFDVQNKTGEIIGNFENSSNSFQTEEYTHPNRTMLHLFPFISKALFFISFISLLAFFPLLPKSIHPSPSQLFLPLPSLFNPVQLFSARYLMSIGSIFSLLAAHLCLFLLTTRLVFLLANEFLLPNCKLAQNLKNISAFLATLMVFILLFVPKCWLFHLLPLNASIRINVQAILIYFAHFLPDAESSSRQPEYQRIRGGTIDEEDELSSNAESEQAEQEEEDWKRVAISSVILPHSTAQHNCWHSSCQRANNDEHCQQQHHLYESEGRNDERRMESGSRAAAVLDPDQAFGRAKVALTGIGLLALLCAFSLKALMETEEYTPMLAMFAVAICPPLSLWMAIWLARNRFDTPFGGGAHDSNKWMVPMGSVSLFSIFLLIQIIVLFFNSTQWAGLAICNLIGFLVHFISNRKNRTNR